MLAVDLYKVFKLEFLGILRNAQLVVYPLLFFILICVLFPMGVSPSSALLLKILPGIIWTAVVLAIFMSAGNLFRNEHDDGRLELMALSQRPFVFSIMVKVLANWLLTVCPLVLMAPVVAAMAGAEQAVQVTLFMSLMLGTPVLLMTGAIAAALTVFIPQNGMLLAVLILPLSVPVLIFGAGAVSMAATGDSATGPLYILATLLVLSLTAAPFAITAALRTGVSQ